MKLGVWMKFRFEWTRIVDEFLFVDENSFADENSFMDDNLYLNKVLLTIHLLQKI